MRIAELEGNYCGTADKYVTFLEGIQNRFKGMVIFAEGCHLYKDRSSMLAAAGTDMPKRKPLPDFTDYSIDLL